MLKYLKKASLLDQVTIIISITLLVQLLITNKLWMTLGRSFPAVPVTQKFPFDIPLWLDQGFFFLGIFLLFLLIFMRRRRFLLNLFFVWAGLMVLMDVNRLQPWYYQFMLMIWVAGFASKQKEGQSSILATLRFIIIATYIWSGINKLNIHFGETNFPWIMDSIDLFSFLGEYSFIGYGLGVFEILLGISFLMPRFWHISVPAGILFHLLIFLFLGPLGHNWNPVIWPWNFGMIFLLWIIFPTRFVVVPDVADQTSSVRRFMPFYAILLLLGLLPILSFFNLWDNPLSMTMYSGLNTEAMMYYQEEEKGCFPTLENTEITKRGTKEYLSLDDWAMEEMRVPFYSKKNIYKKLGRQLCTCITDKENAGITMLSPAGRWDKNTIVEELNCLELVKFKEEFPKGFKFTE